MAQLPAAEATRTNEYVWQVLSNNDVVFTTCNLSNTYRFQGALSAIDQDKYIDTINTTTIYILLALVISVVIPISLKVAPLDHI